MQRLLNPMAMLLSAAIIGGGIYLGLRSRPVIIQAAPEPRSSTRRTAPTAQIQRTGSEAAQAEHALEKARPALVDACWHPAKHNGAGQPHETFQIRLYFGANGRLIWHSVADPADGKYRDVAQCLRRFRPDVSLPAAGGPSAVQVPVELP